ncbi:MAG: hypothetical protein JWR67_1636 [Mucilaginibacter sp.]|nr:hypothetical protein [Mucilaginibacter sp.]
MIVLNNVRLIDGNGPVSVQIIDNKITKVFNDTAPDKTDALQLTFDNALIFPGLINSHDHLDFNLFPALGNKIYNSYTEWGKYIHENYKNEISKVLKVPVLLREQWGILKNLLCGVTTVVNHGEKLKTTDTLISVHEQYYCLHSVQFEKKWRLKLNHPFKRKFPVVIHIGEGNDQASYHEIDQLIYWNFLQKTLVGIHAVAMSDKQAKKFKAIVWCPQSNFFLLDKTARIEDLKKQTNILFGTDSTLTGSWNIWEHICAARKTAMLTDTELYNSLHVNASNTWKLNNKEIKSDQDADIVVAAIKNGATGMDAFFSISPKDILLVTHQGNIRLFDASIYNQLAKTDLSNFSKIYIDGIGKYVQSDVPALIKHIRKYYPAARFPVTIN